MFMSSIVKGDADAGGFIRASFKDMVENFLPHRDREKSKK